MIHRKVILILDLVIVNVKTRVKLVLDLEIRQIDQRMSGLKLPRKQISGLYMTLILLLENLCQLETFLRSAKIQSILF